MPTRVETLAAFRKQIKNLNRKYPSVTHDVRLLVLRLNDGERPGQRIPRVGFAVYKVCLPNRAARRGKSGGFRVIYYAQIADTVTLLAIYSKSEDVDISIREIQQLAREADESRR